MRTFFALVVLLFGLFAAGWSWYTGDTRPFELSFWKQAIYGSGLVDKSTAKATLGDVADAGKVAKKVAEKVAKKVIETAAPKKAAAPDPVVVAYKVVGSPDGRYVKAMAGNNSGTNDNSGSAGGEITRVGAPAGRYVEAKTDSGSGAKTNAGTKAIEIPRVGSPGGRYVEAAPPAPDTKFARVSPPDGRYVDAPKMVEVEKPRTIARVGQPEGRYVSTPRIMAVKSVDTAKIERISSPAGRYVDAPMAKGSNGSDSGSLTRVSSPAGRYVDAPMSSEGIGVFKRVSSPAGRYVDGPAAPRRESKIPEGYTINTGAGWPEKAVMASAAEPKKSKSGALVFPITFEYRKSTFTSDGARAADQLLAHIKQKGYSKVTLTGHTDSRGGEAVNLRISKRRLDAVADHLRAGGFKGALDLQPKGKSQPFDGVDRSKYSEEELWDLDRRVELVSGS